jgi:large subunit ribosomal protein L5
MKENPMREIKIEKVTLNIGCGNDQGKIERAKKLLEFLSNQKTSITTSKRRSTFGVPKGKPIGVKVTLRKKRAQEFFKSVLQSLDNKLKNSFIDEEGNINIGIKEYLELPNIRYDPNIGMLGLDVTVTLERPGYKIKRRRIEKRKIPKEHKIKKEDVINWLKENYKVDVIE